MNTKSTKPENINFEDLIHFVGASGNANILFGHITKLQLGLDKLGSQKRNIVVDTDFFCWLMLYSNYIITRLESLYQMKGENRLQDKGISALVMLFVKDLQKHKVIFDEEKIETAVELRHSFFHFGIPNLVRVKMNAQVKNTVKRCLEDYVFAKHLFEEVRGWTLKVPSNPVSYKNSIQIG